MGTLYAHPDYAKAYLRIAMEYGIPANAIKISNPAIVAKFREKGHLITDDLV